MRAEFGAGVADQTINGLVYGRLKQRVEATLRSGKTAIVDATFIKKSWRKDYLDIAKRVGVRTKAVVFSAPKHVLVARVNERAKSGGLFVPEDVIAKYINDLQIPVVGEFDEVEKVNGN
jgi:predicted kinase